MKTRRYTVSLHLQGGLTEMLAIDGADATDTLGKLMAIYGRTITSALIWRREDGTCLLAYRMPEIPHLG